MEPFVRDGKTYSVAKMITIGEIAGMDLIDLSQRGDRWELDWEVFRADPEGNPIAWKERAEQARKLMAYQLKNSPYFNELKLDYTEAKHDKYIIWVAEYHPLEGFNFLSHSNFTACKEAYDLEYRPTKADNPHYRRWLKCVGLRDCRLNKDRFHQWSTAMALYDFRQIWPPSYLEALQVDEDPAAVFLFGVSIIADFWNFISIPGRRFRFYVDHNFNIIDFHAAYRALVDGQWIWILTQADGVKDFEPNQDLRLVKLVPAEFNQ